MDLCVQREGFRTAEYRFCSTYGHIMVPPVEDIATITRAAVDHWLVVALVIFATSLVCANLIFFIYFQLAIHRNVIECRRRLSGEFPSTLRMRSCQSKAKITKGVRFLVAESDAKAATGKLSSKQERNSRNTMTKASVIDDQLANITPHLPRVNPREAAMCGFYLARVFRLLPLMKNFAKCRVGELLRHLAGVSECKPKAMVRFEKTFPDAADRKQPWMRSSGIRRTSAIVLTPERLCELRRRYGMSEKNVRGETKQLKGGSSLNCTISTSLPGTRRGDCGYGRTTETRERRRQQPFRVDSPNDLLHDVTCQRITAVNVVLTGSAWRRHCGKWTFICGSAQLWNERALVAYLVLRDDHVNSSPIYLFHIFTQGKPKQLTLVSIGALHTIHIVINMYVNLNIIQYSQICASITHIKTLHV